MFPPWAGHICQELGIPRPAPATATVSHLLTLPTQTRRELVYYQTISWPQGWVLQFCPMGTAKFSLEQWRENCCQVRARRTLGPNVAIMINSLVLHDLPWNLNSLYPPYTAPTKLIYIVSSDYTFSLGSCYLDTSYFSYFDPNAACPSPLKLSFLSHLKFTVFNIYPRSFPPLDSSKNAHIFSFMQIIHPI